MLTSKKKFSIPKKRRFVDRSNENFIPSKKETGILKGEEIPRKKRKNFNGKKATIEVETPEAALNTELKSVPTTDGFCQKERTHRSKDRKNNLDLKTLKATKGTGGTKLKNSVTKEKRVRKSKDRKKFLSSKPFDSSLAAARAEEEHFPSAKKLAKKRKMRRNLIDVPYPSTQTAAEANSYKEHVEKHHPSTNELMKKKLERSIKWKGVNNSDKLTDDLEEKCATKVHVAPLKTSGFCWNADPKLLAKVIEPNNDSESSDDEDENVSKKKKKRQTVAEKREAAKKEEERLRAIEESLASNSNLPSSCDEFDRALLSKPDSSELWLQYMAFHLQATEIEKARAVAQRALKTISYRKEQEKFNIWVGLLNLENLYGTQETLKKTLSEALQLNDAYKVRVQMINIFAENGKLQELESEIKLVAKKFRDVKGMWLEIGTILYKYGHIEHARRLLQQSLSAQRNKNETVSLISRFAMMEAKFGQMERALALFDSILVSHPQRVDVWSVCVDQLCKAGMFEQARSTLDRAISQKLKSRWMKVLFAKYLSFEEKYGTPEGSERVREKAREYVEKVSSLKLD